MPSSLRVTTAIFIAFTGLTTCATPRTSDMLPARFAFTHVTVIDGNGAAPKPDHTVVVSGERIAWVGPASEADLSDIERIIDAAGQYMIPGLWDMHVHPDDPEIWELLDPPAHLRDLFMPNFIAWGVTGVRDMGGNFDVIKSWRNRIEAGDLVGPRIVAAGPLVDGPEPMWMGSVPVATAEQGRRAVDSLLAEGVDFIKVYSLLPREAFFAVMERAKELGVRVAGHVPRNVTLEEALEAGMDNQEHLLKIANAFTDEIVIRGRLRSWEAGLLENGDSVTPARRAMARALHIWSGYDPIEAGGYFRRLAAADVWLTPTLIVFDRNETYDPNDSTIVPLLPYVPEYLRTWWTPDVNVHLRDRSGWTMTRLDVGNQMRRRVVAGAHDEGVRMLAGSDTGGNPHLVPGFSLHEELELLVEAGLSPMDALKTATINPAEYLGLADQLGTVETGKAADLVILDANPLEDITNTRAIAGIVYRGVFLDRAGRDRLLDAIREAAR